MAKKPILIEWAPGEWAEIVTGASIRIFGVKDYGIKDLKPYDKTFKIGDIVIHGSYNLIYTGPIVGIGAKTVSVKPAHESKKKMMKIASFATRNWNLDLESVSLRNHDTMMHI